MKTNKEIAEIFEDIAFLLEIKGENPFKIRSYKKVAELLKTIKKPLSEIREEGKLRELEGVGEAISKKIEEILNTGDCNLRRRLKEEFSEDLIKLRKVKGIGPKTAKKIYEKLGKSELTYYNIIRKASDILSATQIKNLKEFFSE